MKTLFTLAFSFLFTVGFVVIHLFDVDHKQMESMDLESDLMWYRAGFYFLVLATWPKLSELMVVRRERHKLAQDNIVFESKASEAEYIKDIKEESNKEIFYHKEIWWKVAVFFVLFEIRLEEPIKSKNKA